MEKNRRYTTMIFPQEFDGNNIKVHIVLIPRNRNPFDPIDTYAGAPADNVTPFADLVPEFSAFVINSLEDFPVANTNAPIKKPQAALLQGLSSAPNKKQILTALRDESGLKIKPPAADDKIGDPIPIEKSVSKYLPETYRSSFNFTTPRHKNAKTDDSYHCAMREEAPKVPLTVSSDDISWGQVYGYILRQPLLARAAGLVYEATIPLTDAGWFTKGGYLYVDLVNADYQTVQDDSLSHADGVFIKRYAARIPKLKAGVSRTLFAPILFPVLVKADPDDPVEPVPAGNWDNIFAESNEYNDGFAKIVHANQPVSKNILTEQFDGTHPVHDAGIRMGWDDEQILIWYIRQLRGDENNFNAPVPGVDDRIDALLGVFGYRIDVRDAKLAEEDPGNPAAKWQSLNTVVTNADYRIGTKSVGNAIGVPVELPYQVYPTQIDGNVNAGYWLPMYYTNWIGKSLVMKDSDAAEINYHTQSKKNPSTTSQLFNAGPLNISLLYGKTYDFRVRLCDLSNGGPTVNHNPVINAPSPTTNVHFKRYIAPGKLRIVNAENAFNSASNSTMHIDFFNATIVNGEEKFAAAPNLEIKRPVLGYPAVVFTNKYQSIGQDPVQLLKDISVLKDPVTGKLKPQQVEPVLADPDVKKVEVTVEVETLRLDNLLSGSGQENYALLYSTFRNFPGDFDGTLNIPIIFENFPVLNLSNSGDPLNSNSNPFNNSAFDKTSLNAMTEIILPTARKVRITVRAVCEGDDQYYKFINEADHNLDTRYGATSQFFFYKESGAENNLLLPKPNVPTIQALYLQPDPPFVNNGKISTVFFQREGMVMNQPDIVQRLANEIGVESKGLTLVSKKGERIVFGCSSRIRHSLAPDNSSVTFASKAELAGHWLGCIVYKLNRDWSWDALDIVSFEIGRTKKFKKDAPNEKEVQDILGDIEINHSVSFEALQPDEFGIINRDHTTIIFIDAVETKIALKQANGLPRFPDEQEVEYTITPKFKKDHGVGATVTQPDKLNLPTTIRPAQVPKLVSAGVAFSPYQRNTKYSATEARKKFLWLEFEEPVADPNDTIFGRVLAYAPDQLISNNNPELFFAPEEPPLPIDPEYTRKITPLQSDDKAGLNAMQPLTKATDSDRHYLLPIPPGMHNESDELFGFFTYEFRIGHNHWTDRDENLWSTAQGRFGRALRVTGIQHPAPTLLCTLNRDNKRLYVHAPYARAVANGKNMTAYPPRTQLWALLYAQVKQADGLDYRNILLDEKYLDWKKKVFDIEQLADVNRMIFRELKVQDEQLLFKKDIIQINQLKIDKAVLKAIKKDLPVTGTCVWENTEISKLLELYGLPDDSALSIVAVEVFGNIKSLREHITNLNQRRVRENMMQSEQVRSVKATEKDQQQFRTAVHDAAIINDEDLFADVKIKPLSNGLGHYRILRTSPLTEVPFVCCPC
jgi:hypothetical protein